MLVAYVVRKDRASSFSSFFPCICWLRLANASISSIRLASGFHLILDVCAASFGFMSPSATQALQPEPQIEPQICKTVLVVV